SRLMPLKRQLLILQALPHTREPVAVRFAGSPDDPAFGLELRETAERLGVSGRVEWLGQVSEERKRELYSGALGVIFPPEDEDYGYITLEAMLSAKPVISCSDSGGPLEFVLNRETGLICEPTPVALAAAMDELWANPSTARRWGLAGRERWEEMGIS